MNSRQRDAPASLSELQRHLPAAATFWRRYLEAADRARLDTAAPVAPLPAGSSNRVMLNLGCGGTLLPGFVNVDIVEGPGIQVADLRQPWPWADDSVDYIYASHVIEHLPDKILTMNELWRVMRAGALALIHVPTTEGSGAWQDPTHVSFWNRRSFLYFEDGSPYRDGFASSYGIRAKLRTRWELLTPTPDGPQLSMLLQPVKP
jgi:SAM-dependent methyltransferase